MRTIVTTLLLLIGCFQTLTAQDQKAATQDGQVFPTASNVKGQALVLFGNDNEQNFLTALSVAPNKGRFICDNISSQSDKSYTVTLSKDGKFHTEFKSGSWPVNETIAICGTVTLKQSYEGDSVDTDFKFAAWGSASAYPDLVNQIPNFTPVYVDYCPQYDTHCENKVQHPEPVMPDHTATISGNVSAHDCASKAAIRDAGVMQVVLNNTDEGRNFNSSGVADICEAIPKDFANPRTSGRAWLDVDENGNASYSLDVTFTGGSVSGVVYLCAYVDRRQGSDQDSCSGYPTVGKMWKQQAVTLYPNGIVKVDAQADYTK